MAELKMKQLPKVGVAKTKKLSWLVQSRCRNVHSLMKDEKSTPISFRSCSEREVKADKNRYSSLTFSGTDPKVSSSGLPLGDKVLVTVPAGVEYSIPMALGVALSDPPVKSVVTLTTDPTTELVRSVTDPTTEPSVSPPTAVVTLVTVPNTVSVKSVTPPTVEFKVLLMFETNPVVRLVAVFRIVLVVSVMFVTEVSTGPRLLVVSLSTASVKLARLSMTFVMELVSNVSLIASPSVFVKSVVVFRSVPLKSVVLDKAEPAESTTEPSVSTEFEMTSVRLLPMAEVLQLGSRDGHNCMLVRLTRAGLLD